MDDIAAIELADSQRALADAVAGNRNEIGGQVGKQLPGLVNKSMPALVAKEYAEHPPAPGKDGRSIKGEKGDKGDPGLNGVSTKGAKGDDGAAGRDGVGPDEKVKLDAKDPKAGYLEQKLRPGMGVTFRREGGTIVVEAQSTGGSVGGGGQPGPPGLPGAGVPDGGTIHQILAKASDDDLDTEWVDPAAGTGAVDSVNGQTGVVVLDAGDVGALATAEQTFFAGPDDPGAVGARKWWKQTIADSTPKLWERNADDTDWNRLAYIGDTDDGSGNILSERYWKAQAAGNANADAISEAEVVDGDARAYFKARATGDGGADASPVASTEGSGTASAFTQAIGAGSGLAEAGSEATAVLDGDAQIKSVATVQGAGVATAILRALSSAGPLADITAAATAGGATLTIRDGTGAVFIWTQMPFVEPTTATPEAIVNALIASGLMAAA